MEQIYEYKGITKDDAIRKAELDLGIDKEAFIIDVESAKDNKTMFSILDKENITVKIKLKEDKVYKNKFDSKDLEKAKTNVEAFLEKLKLKYNDINFEYDVKTSGRRIYVNINNDENPKWIGQNANALEAMQNILYSIAQRDFKRRSNIRVYTNIGNYKEEKKNRLIRLADKAANTVMKQQIRISMDPMNSYERRIVHSYLQQNEQIKTESFGEGKDRHIVISPAL